MHLSQRGSCKMFKPCLKMFERAEHTQHHPTHNAGPKVIWKRLKSIVFHAYAMSWNSLGILPIEIWISNGVTPFVGRHPNPFEQVRKHKVLGVCQVNFQPSQGLLQASSSLFRSYASRLHTPNQKYNLCQKK